MKRYRNAFKNIIIAMLLVISVVMSCFTYTYYKKSADEKNIAEFYAEENDLLRFRLSELNSNYSSLSERIDQADEIQSQFYEYEYLYDEVQMKYEMLKIDYYLLENYKFEMNKRIAYLTFDDGPTAETYKMLDVLDQYNVKATFFVNKANGEVIKEISDRGHLIANHTASHQYKDIYSDSESFKNDIKELEEYVFNLTGQRTNIFRFPGGSNTGYVKKITGSKDITQFQKDLQDMGYTYFDWNVDSGDASGNGVPAAKIAKNVLSQAKGKREAVILMHSLLSKKTTTEALPVIIEGLMEQGFTFETLSTDTAPIRFIPAE